MNDRALRAMALSLLVFCLAMMGAGIVIRLMRSTLILVDVVTMLPLPLLAGLITIQKPRHPIGWVMLVIATAVGGSTISYTIVEMEGVGSFAAGLAQLVNHISFAFMVGSFGLLLALFPNGQVASPRWCLLRYTTVASTILIGVSGIFGSPDDTGEVPSPFAIEGAQEVLVVIGGIGMVLGFLSIVAGGISVVVRARTGNDTERAQIKWFAFGVGALVVLMLIGQTPLGRGRDVTPIFEVLLLLIVGVVLPGCLAVAILKHRLYDIDVIVNRTLVYGALTALLAASYLAIVVLLQRLVEPITQESDLAVAASTLAVAALFRPLRSRVQTFIDQRFYRRKYDAVQALSGFSAHLREQVDLESLRVQLVGVVGETMQPAHASLWLRLPHVSVEESS